MKKLLKKFECPLCSSNDVEQLYEFNTTILIDSEITQWSYNHVLCQNCAVIMVYPLPSEKILDKYYQNAFPFELQNYENRQIQASVFMTKFIGRTKRSVVGDHYHRRGRSTPSDVSVRSSPGTPWAIAHY